TAPKIENRPPELRRFGVVEPRAHAAEEVSVVAAATDADLDRLDYFWTVSRGTMPLGRIGPIIKWQTADTRGVDTVTVRITDRQDTIWTHLAVSLVTALPPDSVWTLNSRDFAQVNWSPSKDEGIDNWVGYDVYASEESLAGEEPESVEAFKVTSEPLTTYATRVRPLEQGKRYYFHVRSVREFAGTTERSASGMETDMSPRPSGSVSGLNEVGGGRRTVFDLSEGAIRAFDPSNSGDMARMDLFIEADPDDPTEELRIRSVSHLAAENPAWAERVIEMKLLGEDFDVSGTGAGGTWVTEARIDVGQVFAVRTPEGNYGKIQITAIQRFMPDRTVWLNWAYQTIPDYISF
ncbi:MAG: fibronectin type III domain-containing protein, partial [Candidatus Eisenbacteria bacterium]